MKKAKKLLFQVLRGTSDKNISFLDLCHLLHCLRFEERTKGSHHNFRRTGINDKINLQKDSNNNAKPYQVRQVRNIIIKYKLGGEL